MINIKVTDAFWLRQTDVGYEIYHPDDDLVVPMTDDQGRRYITRLCEADPTFAIRMLSSL